MPATYQSIIIEKPAPPAVKIYPDEPVTMAQCAYCHPDLDSPSSFMKGRLVFAHGTHLQRDFDCTVCHNEFAHTPDDTTRPDMLSCYRCHGLVHAGQGAVAGVECEKCHPPGFELKPADHTEAFVSGTHKKRATRDPEYCAMCHEPAFCVECHTGKQVIPNDHKNAKWLTRHGPLYLAGKGACGSCHDDPSCKRCHTTVMPHPTDWLTSHSKAAKADSSDCDVCHTDKSSCQACHHDRVKNAYLVEKNCKPCHDEMSLKPATSIQQKAFAEHAVHFIVEEKKGKPYRCFECHVDFGGSASAKKVAVQQGHDLRLCYDCHGANDPFNVQIAPYVGAELCVRCHQNLRI